MQYSNIKVQDGDLLDCPEGINVIIHQANVNNAMGAGIAAQIKKRFPFAWEADCQAARDNRNRMGMFSWGLSNDQKLMIINMYGQYLGATTLNGSPTSYDAVFGAMQRIRKWLDLGVEHGNNIAVGMPYLMGCDLGGADWEIYSKILDKTFDGVQYPVWFIKWNK